jgi:Peptidase inhibitor family I36
MTSFTRGTGARYRAPSLCVLAVIGAAFAGALSLSVSAARADYTNCGTSRFCIWHDANYSGGFCAFNETNNGSNTWFGTGACWDGSSLYNNRSFSSRYSANILNGSEIDCITPGNRIAHLGNYTYNDGLNENDETYWAYLYDPRTACP